jgi:lipopolysaccharide export LptBFGC system permease protein LptF
VLILLAIPLGFVNPRAGSSANLIIALLIFFSYNNFVKLVEASVRQGKTAFAVSWWPLHLRRCCWCSACSRGAEPEPPLSPAGVAGRVQARALRQQEGCIEMKILQRYFAVSILQAVAFVLVAFLALQAFMDLTGELPKVGKNGYAIQYAFLYVLAQLPGHVYEVMPLAALIGTIYTMAQFAATSEFTIMRASSMSTGMVAWMLAKIGVVLVVLTFIVGELVVPRTAPLAEKSS